MCADIRAAHAVSRSQIVAVAQAEVGASEANGECLKYGPCQSQEWCAYFASWVWRAAGVSPVFSTAIGRGVGAWGVEQGLFSARPSGGIGDPRPGDLVVYGAPAYTVGGHVAVVASVNGNGTIDTIDGNWNEQVVRRTIDPVSARGGSDNLLISGYVRPPGVTSGSTGQVSDFNGDGRADVLGVNSAGDLYWYRNNSNDVSTGVKIGQGWGTWRHVFAADFNGDGRADVLGVNSAGDLYWYRNNSNDVSTGVKIGQGWGTWRHVFAADFNGDGRADVLG
ncbi:FG-GAP-like repeat-containing protein, partial [Nonomuraea sp. NPDC050310]|uniref:FG-GAP-like repeat-containing protein n=1 Tax=Nonomuraea sp. NPDC050310 TaxID=3154935 RepID=UPI0034029A68